MTIRYTCSECGSVLKIKDELAGTPGKCPKCKTKFTVPEPGHGEDEAAASAEQKAPAKAKAEKPTASAPAGGDDFDVDSFLMEGGPVAPKEESKTPSGPPKDSRGRRRIVPTNEDDELHPEASSAAAAAQAAMGGGAASANAKDLLTQTAENSRVRASSMPEEESGPRFDFSTVRAQLMQSAPMIVGAIVGIAVLYFGMAYMMSNPRKLPDLANVSGSVTLNGKPMKNMYVMLTPVKKSAEYNGREIRLTTAMGLTDDEGYYEAKYFDDVEGVPIGKVRLWLQPLNPEDQMKIPPQYVSPSNDIREVREAGNEGKFNLELKTE